LSAILLIEIVVSRRGLSGYVTDEVIGDTLRANPDRKTCAAELVHRTLENGAPDNVTVIVADIEETA
jgi:protein phosphatase